MDANLLAAPRTEARRSAWGTAGFWWVALSATAIAVFAPLPYLRDSLTQLASDNQIAAHYAARPQWAQVAFYLHAGFGGLALLLSPAQFSARLRARAPRAHRVVGRVTLISIGLAGTAGLILAPQSLAGATGTIGFGALALLWLAFATVAVLAIRRGDVAAHRRWMIRTFALTYAAVTLRLWLPVLIVGQVAVLHTSLDDAFTRAYLVMPFLAWIPNLLITEWVLRLRRVRCATR